MSSNARKRPVKRTRSVRQAAEYTDADERLTDDAPGTADDLADDSHEGEAESVMGEGHDDDWRADTDSEPYAEPEGDVADESGEEPGKESGESEIEDDEVEADALTWEIERDDPNNPFSARLVFYLGGEEVLWWNLDPYGLKELTGGLRAVQRAQLAVISGQPEPTEAPPPRETTVHKSTKRPAASQRTQGKRRDKAKSDNLSWLARHKVTGGLLIMVGVLFVWSFIASSLR